MSRTDSNHYLPHVDGLRAVAVLGVILYHAYPRAVPGGFMGVDVFFVISGFLISSILYRDFAAPGRGPARVFLAFYLRRVRRIFPALLVVLAAVIAWGFFTQMPSGFVKTCQQAVAGACFYANILFAGQSGYFEAEGLPRPLLHLWSLGVEEQFYLVWPLVICLCLRFRRSLVPAVVFLGALSFFWNQQKTLATTTSAFFLIQSRFWELAVGALAAALVRRHGPIRGPGWVPSAAALGALGAVLYGFARVHSDLYYPDTKALIPTLGTAVLVAIAPEAWACRAVLGQPVLVGIGLISYPLYLWHWPLLVCAPQTPGFRDGAAARACLLAAAAALGWLTYAFVETPVRRGPLGLRRPLLLAGAMAALAAFALEGSESGGFPSRFPPMMLALSNYTYDPSKAWRTGTGFMNKNGKASDFRDDPADIRPGRPTVLVWGDSHAAALCPGLRACYGRDVTLVQRTVAGLAPLLGDVSNFSDYEQEMNAAIFQSIVDRRPDEVILEANWLAYDWRKITVTLDELAKRRIKTVLVGPVPNWTSGLPGELFAYMRHHPGQPLPWRLNTGLRTDVFTVDREMRALAAAHGALYLSPCAALGNKDGFLVRTGEGVDSLTAFDYGHLTPSGSLVVARSLPFLEGLR